MNEFETMESMYSRLKGTGEGAQAEAVISSIKLIRKAPGVLDSTNVAVALYHIAIAFRSAILSICLNFLVDIIVALNELRLLHKIFPS